MVIFTALFLLLGCCCCGRFLDRFFATFRPLFEPLFCSLWTAFGPLFSAAFMVIFTAFGPLLLHFYWTLLQINVHLFALSLLSDFIPPIFTLCLLIFASAFPGHPVDCGQSIFQLGGDDKQHPALCAYLALSNEPQHLGAPSDTIVGYSHAYCGA